MDNIDLKYWCFQEMTPGTFNISLKEPFPQYFSENNKIIIFFHKSIIPIFNQIVMFRDRDAVTEYFFSRHKQMVYFQRDIEISYKEHIFTYPFVGFLEDDFSKGFTFKFRKNGDLEKLLRSLERKYERLLSYAQYA